MNAQEQKTPIPLEGTYISAHVSGDLLKVIADAPAIKPLVANAIPIYTPDNIYLVGFECNGLTEIERVVQFLRTYHK